MASTVKRSPRIRRLPPSSAPSERQVVAIDVERLFGRYTYHLRFASPASQHPLMILYGDNGSGKTTILNLLFHILACEDAQGHKSYVSKSVFGSFRIHFSDGLLVETVRPQGQTRGSFTMNVLQNGNILDTCDFIATPEHTIPKEHSPTTDFLARFRQFGMTLYFLSDSRIVSHSSYDRGRAFPNSPFDLRELQEGMELFWSGSDVYFRGQQRKIEPHEIQARLLEASMNSANNYLRSRARESASQGELNSAAFYRSIVLRLTKTGAMSKPFDPANTAVMLKDIAEANRKYEKYGFLPEYDHEPMIKAIESLDAEGQNSSSAGQVGAILDPYIEGIKAKHTALSTLQEFLDRMINSLNESFLSGKRISFDVRDGFKVCSTADGSEIAAENLSSGERHLLLIFMNAVNSLERPTIFIVDEPEISLNVKWQRKLISTLLGCIDQTSSQYILATHSIELLTEHSDSVVQLEDENDAPKRDS